MTTILDDSEVVGQFAQFGIRAFTTTRTVGSFGLASSEPVRDVSARWAALRRELRGSRPRLATAGQVHGATVTTHGGNWEGWLRGEDADGHVVVERGTAVAVTVADCVPVFVAHPSGAVALLHAGWRGTVGGILARGIDELARHRIERAELHAHFGPAICGSCYEVGPDVYAKLTGRSVGEPMCVDLRALLADQARSAGIRHITSSASCTRCDNDRFFSHRAGDEGRQLGVMIADQES